MTQEFNHGMLPAERVEAEREEADAGEKLYRRGGVRLLESGAGSLRYLVADIPPREVIFGGGSRAACGCEAWQNSHACRHVTAASLLARETGALEGLLRRRAAEAGTRLMRVLEGALPEDGTLRMEITLFSGTENTGKAAGLKVGLRVGEERLYVVRSIPRFIESMETGESLPFAKGFTFRPEWMRFTPAEARAVHVLRALCAAQRDAGAVLHGSEERVMRLPEPFAAAMLEALRGLPFRLALRGQIFGVRGVETLSLPLHYRVRLSSRGMTVAASLPGDFLPLLPSCAFGVFENRVVSVPREQLRVLRVLLAEQLDGQSVFDFPPKEIPRVMDELLPFLRRTGAVELDGALEKQLVRLPLTARVYLDKDGQEVVARTLLCYGSREIDPFDEQGANASLAKGVPLVRDEKLLLRDAPAERRVLDALADAGFRVRRGRVYLADREAVYAFVTEGVGRLQQVCEVYLSRDFRKMAPRRPQLRGRMGLRGSRLELTLSDDGTPIEELPGLLEALARRRNYFRLRDGSFLDIRGMAEWQTFAESVYEALGAEGGAAEASCGGVLTLNPSRTCYLASLLEACRLPVEQDSGVQGTLRALTQTEEDAEMPQGLALRPYQQRGYQWLKTLDKLRMGGILADEMGLGKTIQVIALLKTIHREEAPRGVSLVVCPTSLCYNWLSELNRFAPELSAMVLGGTGAQRASQIRHVKESEDVEVLITSYPLIRRDGGQMAEIPFRLAVLDEAQHIKNADSVGAAAVKQLQAQTRFALTGTPVENGIGDLWSLFDFVLPGYLGRCGSFLRRYQDGQNAEDLRRKIRPFLLRRLKQDVLTELPNKLETTLTAEMTPEQRRVYRAAMPRLRARVDHVMEEKGLSRGRAEVLAALTELRQICCHPALVLSDYDGSSGKLELLLEVLSSAVPAGRRVLLFSQFAAMLRILRRELEAAGYACMLLDGKTPAAQRLAMTEEFNAGNGQIFLISLKAGGTGLNLTGADTVIHYDPWWNPAAEDQATDRAHRIGQTRKVEVIRLVTHASMEEQVVSLGQRKRALFEQLITPGEELVTRLSEQDIRALFS